MKCVNIKIIVEGIVSSKEMSINKIQALECIVTNDKRGKTLSINNGDIHFTIPFEPLEKYLR